MNKLDRSKLFETLKERGYVYQATNEENVRKIINGNPTTVYVGIDPTADSLHIGHFFSLMMLKYFQDAGHRVIVLIGGATAMVGDPSGRTDMRQMMTKERVQNNFNEVKALVEKFVDITGENPAIIVNNADWFNGYDYVSFMRDVGKHFNVNEMLTNDAYSRRLQEGGLTFLEMGYMLMQAYDFVYLNKKYGCMLQIGGSDQWGNMTAGTKLSRKIAFENNTASNLEALTCPLLTNSEGQKMGKTAKGALWVAREKTSVFDFYQYFYNVQDKDVLSLLRLFTRLPLEEINSMIHNDIISAKKIMAFEITKLIHGNDEAVKAREMSENLFSQGGDDAPEFEVAKTELGAGIGICDLLFNTKLAPSKSEARRLIQGGAISVKGEKISDFTLVVKESDFEDGSLLLKKGKKNFIKVVLK
ncbi:MAG: tyrosine--tRNA ligase [Clostridia bacterium]|nr:tyrosine--tRNA ligase [Clostridia bacterium]